MAGWGFKVFALVLLVNGAAWSSVWEDCYDVLRQLESPSAEDIFLKERLSEFKANRSTQTMEYAAMAVLDTNCGHFLRHLQVLTHLSRLVLECADPDEELKDLIAGWNRVVEKDLAAFDNTDELISAVVRRLAILPQDETSASSSDCRSL